MKCWLLQIPLLWVTGRVIRQKAKDKQRNKEGNNNIDGNFEGDHTNSSRNIKNSNLSALLDRSPHHTEMPLRFRCVRVSTIDPSGVILMKDVKIP